jgi:threonine/homoserine/homoserine lactone efflux protein
LRRGARGGFAALSGIIAGNTLYFVLSAAGVVALVQASYAAFTVLKYAGAAYLAYLGIRSLLAREAEADPSAAIAPGEGRRAFSAGFVTQVSNPKAIVFFVAILPQFVDAHGNLALQIAILTVVSQSIEAVVLGAYVAGAARLRRMPIASRASLWFERAGGGILLAIAARIAREPLIVR